MPTTDPIMASLDKILKSGEYEEIAGVPIFDVHQEFDGDGTLLDDYDETRLQGIVDACNKRGTTGDLCPFGPGHTVEDKWDYERDTAGKFRRDAEGRLIKSKLLFKAKESDQPDLHGYFHQFQVGRFGPKQKIGILANMLVKRQVRLPDGRVVTGKEAVSEYPRRSIELWPPSKGNHIDWVALLKRSPERDLGLLTFQKTAADDSAPLQPEPLFSDHAKTRPLMAYQSPAGKLRYAMDECDDPLDPTAPPDANAPDADFMAKFEKCMMHYLKTTQGTTAMPDTAAAAAPTTATPPAATIPEPEKLRMQKDQHDAELSRFRKEVDDMRAEVLALREENVKSSRAARLARYERDLSSLRNKDYILDVPQEMEDCAGMDEVTFDKHLERIKRSYSKALTGGAMAQTITRGIEGGEKKPAAMDEDELESVIQYMRIRNIDDFGDAKRQYQKERTERNGAAK